MARITVEDCLQHINNRFVLVLEASRRARKLALGAVEPLLAWENDKPTVLALREIAAGNKFTDDTGADISAVYNPATAGLAKTRSKAGQQSNAEAAE